MLLSWPTDDAHAAGLERLTPAQREVTRLALGGLSDEAIARRTGRSRHTVSNLLRQAYRRYGLSTRIELAALLATLTSS